MYHLECGGRAWSCYGFSARTRKDSQLKSLTAEKWRSALGRKVTTFLVLLCFCTATIPIPIATFDLLDKDSSQPFPCQKCPCGCKTAEQCWTNCCCFTPAERFAWAEKNGVTPPSYAQRPARDEKVLDKKQNAPKVGEGPALAKSTCCEPRKACCEKHVNKKVLNPKTIGPTKSDCCASTESKSCGSWCQAAKVDKAESKTFSNSTKRKVVLSMFALKCQGKSSAFTLLPWTILTKTHEVEFATHECGPAHLLPTRNPAMVFYKPDTPPPKQMLS